ncbi:MAG TPA: helix-turn-helix domain-containing protein [Chitinophaga sp.]
MLSISILALQNATAASVADACYVFTKVNEFLERSGRGPAFNVKLVGQATPVRLNGGFFSLHPDLLLINAHKTDLVIIPSLSGDMISAALQHEAYVPWIIRQYQTGSEIAALDTGAFLLAHTGLLNGKHCTTHWNNAQLFRNSFPAVKLLDEKIMTACQGLYSSAGNNAYWNLLLFLVEKYTDRNMAVLAAKYFLTDLARNSQLPYHMFSGLKEHTDETVKKAQRYIEQHYREKVTVDQLAVKFRLSRRTLERKFRKAIYHTVVEYIQRVKIEAAKKQLENGRKSIPEIMHDVGYTDIQAFRDVFRKMTDMTPLAYQEQYANRI